MSLLDLPTELLLPIFARLIGEYIHALVFNFILRLWDPVTTLQLVCKPTRTLVLLICRQVAALPADDPHQTVHPPRVIAPYRGLAFNAPATLSPLSLPDNAAPPLLQAYTMLTSTRHDPSFALVYIDQAISFLITAEHRARQVCPRELSDLVLEGIEQHSELMVWEKRIGKWIDAMLLAKSQPNEITDEIQEEINDCLQTLDDHTIPQRVLQTSNLVLMAETLAKRARKVRKINQSLEYLDLNSTPPHSATGHTTDTVL